MTSELVRCYNFGMTKNSDTQATTPALSVWEATDIGRERKACLRSINGVKHGGHNFHGYIFATGTQTSHWCIGH